MHTSIVHHIQLGCAETLPGCDRRDTLETEAPPAPMGAARKYVRIRSADGHLPDTAPRQLPYNTARPVLGFAPTPTRPSASTILLLLHLPDASSLRSTPSSSHLALT